MLAPGWTRVAQAFKSPGLFSLRNLHTANAKPRITVSFNSSFKASFATARFSGIQAQPNGGLLSRKRLLSSLVRRKLSFDPRFFSSNAFQTVAAELPILSPPPVGIWLLASSALVFAVIVVGGVTRLTESGLSITEWRPVSGILPPISQAQWEEEFDKYKLTPEFKLYASLYDLFGVPNDTVG